MVTVRPYRKSGAFTLIELLVVIAIISILASILFPVFAKAREKAKRVTCMSNMSQIGKGMMMYTDDSDGLLPGNSWPDGGRRDARPNDGLGFMTPAVAGDIKTERIWARDVFKYLRTLDVFICPSAGRRAAGGIYDAEPKSPPGGNTSYLLNGVASSKQFTRIKSPAGTVYIHEANVFTCTAQERPYHKTWNDPTTNYGTFNLPQYDNQHNEGANLLYCDGHARWKMKTAITYEEFGVVDPNHLTFATAEPAAGFPAS